MTDSSSASSPALEESPKKVLAAVRVRSMNGYALLSKTGLTAKELADAVEVLLNRELIRVTGDLSADGIGDSVFSVPIDAVGNADVVLGKLRAKKSYY